MFIWRLWNRSNYSMAYVVAASRREAKAIRPDGATWDSYEWRLPMTAPKQRGLFGSGNLVKTPTSQTLDGWPDHPDDVMADRVAKCGRFGAYGDTVLRPTIDATSRPPEDTDILTEDD